MFLLQAWLYISPVAYSSSLVHGGWRYVYNLNPAAGLIDGVRWAVLDGPSPGPQLAVSVGSLLLAPHLRRRVVPRGRARLRRHDLMGEPAIQVENLGKRFRLGVGTARYDTLREALARAVRPGKDDRRDLWALRDVDSGGRAWRGAGDRRAQRGRQDPRSCGSSLDITYPTEGAARTRGMVGALLDVGTGFHPELTGRENVFLSGTVLGMRRREIRARFDEIVEFSGVERFLDTPVKRYSEGMRLRLAFAVAAHLEPPIVVVDEVLAVGDSAFREKCMGKMAEMGRRDRTVLFVSHDLGAITRLCTRAVWLEGGRIQTEGPARQIVSSYLERATPGRLLDAEFDADAGAAAAVQRVTVRDAATGQVLTVPERGRPFAIEIAFAAHEVIPRPKHRAVVDRRARRDHHRRRRPRPPDCRSAVRRAGTLRGLRDDPAVAARRHVHSANLDRQRIRGRGRTRRHDDPHCSAG